jgi:hypothetical protein
VEYLQQDEIVKELTDLVWSYRKFYLPGVESDKTTAEDYQQCQRESETAWDNLQAAFQHKEEFSQEFMGDMSDGSTERITRQLIDWSKEIEWPVSDDDSSEGFWRSTADDPEECTEKTEEFTKERLWPFTKIIR